MTVIQPNSITGINSITVQTGQALNVHDASGNLIRNITSTSGVSTYQALHVGSGTTTSTQGISVGTGCSIVSDAVNTLDVYTAASKRLTIDSSGRLLLGTTTEGHGNADDLTIATSANTGITIRSGTSNGGNIFFSDATSGTGEYAGMISYDHNDNIMTFATTDGTERLRIGSSGHIGIGGATYGSSGQVLTSGGSGSAVSWTTVTGTTINNNADNRVITGSGSANTLEGESNLTFTSDVLQVSSTTQGLGAKYINTGNEYTNLQFSAARTAAGNALGIINAKWNNNHEVAAIYLQAGDDTTNKDDGKITFYTSAASGSISSRLEILNDGDVKVSDGDLVIGTSGHGIDFGATADGTGSSQAEIFDDYEEGDWTPTVSSSNATFTMTGRYTKVGRNVSLWYRISSGGSYSGSSSIQIGGIPFANNSSGVHPVGTSEFYKVNFASGYSDYCSCYMSGNNIQWLRNSSSSGSGNYLTIDLFYSGAAITGWIQYYTDS